MISGVLFAFGAALPFLGLGFLLISPFTDWHIHDPIGWLATFGIVGLALLLAGLGARALSSVWRRMRET